MLPDPHAENRIGFLGDLRQISYPTFQAIMCGGKSYDLMLVLELWTALVAAGIFIESYRASPGQLAFADHSIEPLLLWNHLHDQTFENIFYPASYLHERYSPATVSVDVVLRNGDESRGSGFIIRDAKARQWVLTCKHNIDPKAGIEVRQISTAKGDRVSVGSPKLSQSFDVALYPIPAAPECVPFRLHDLGAVFDEVYTLGYPKIPGAVPGLLGHRGEVNGRTELYLERSPALIISNLVSPGSSGGPVVDRYGRCLGMTIRWLEADWQDERARFSAALPASTILAEIDLLAP